MERELPFQMARQRDALVREIYAAFDGVTRVGGVSWREADVIDDYGSDQERRLARESDREPSWQALVDSGDWPSSHQSEWSFLDAIGFRYYLAPALVRLVQTGDDSGIQYHLTFSAKDKPESSAYTRRWLPLLDPRQAQCVRRAIQHTIALHRLKGERFEAYRWQKTYRSYWASLPLLEKRVDRLPRGARRRSQGEP